ncbi:hypothetical protein T4D_2788 [Trichinella pseudospiralis]|uniref:Uncharacterized protein n=1 Tax=Trichinella pseudospiralis TaxID=6337 RepID=A0A0V1FEV3_TRIPS|nr:hypothetical protein T4D_2788 [Trichinella pseudospiralis]
MKYLRKKEKFMIVQKAKFPDFEDQLSDGLIRKIRYILGKSNLTTSDTDQIIGNNLREKREDIFSKRWRIDWSLVDVEQLLNEQCSRSCCNENNNDNNSSRSSALWWYMLLNSTSGRQIGSKTEAFVPQTGYT